MNVDTPARATPADTVTDKPPVRWVSEYDRLEPLLAHYASLALDDPTRARVRERLTTEYLPLVHHLARRYRNRGVPIEDLVQVGAMGLLRAIDRYDPAVGSGFLAYAIPTIAGEIRRWFRDRTWSIRVPRRLRDLHVAVHTAANELSHHRGHAPRPSEIAAYLDLPVDEVLESIQASQSYSADSIDQLTTPGTDSEGRSLLDRLGHDDPDLERVEIHETLQPLLEALPNRDREIVMLRFYGNMTQTQIGDKLGMSQMPVSRQLSRILTQLRDDLHVD